jgi:hypothetical protein
MPEQLSAEQALNMAKKLLESAEELRQFRLANRATLTPEEIGTIALKESILEGQAQGLAACSISCTAAELADAVSQLTSGIAKLRETASNIEKVRKVIGAATTLASLATSVVSGNPRGIAEALIATAQAFPRSESGETPTPAPTPA